MVCLWCLALGLPFGLPVGPLVRGGAADGLRDLAEDAFEAPDADAALLFIAMDKAPHNLKCSLSDVGRL